MNEQQTKKLFELPQGSLIEVNVSVDFSNWAVGYGQLIYTDRGRSYCTVVNTGMVNWGDGFWLFPNAEVEQLEMIPWQMANYYPKQKLYGIIERHQKKVLKGQWLQQCVENN